MIGEGGGPSGTGTCGWREEEEEVMGEAVSRLLSLSSSEQGY